MRKRSSHRSYFLGIGDKPESIRLIGPFKREVTAINYSKKHDKNVFFNPYKEKITLYLSHDEKSYLKICKELYESVLARANVVDLKDYKKKK